MKLLDNCPMFAKLLFAFLVIALIGAAVGGVGWHGIVHLSKELEDVGEVRLPAVRSMEAMHASLALVKAAERTLLLRRLSPEARQGRIQSIAKYWKAYEAEKAAYDGLRKTAEEATLWKNYLAVFGQWRLEHEKSMQLLTSFKAGNDDVLEQALTIALGSQWQAEHAMTDALEALIAYNTKLAHEQVHAGKAIASNSERRVLIAVFGGLLVSLCLGLLLARSIQAPLRRAVTMMDELRRGHLGQRLRTQRRDEIGQMAQALDEFADHLQHNFVAALDKMAQ
ncbi:MAG: hypothetical protein BWK76_21025, partial [Desulfobulbaceae bacterium A2]